VRRTGRLLVVDNGWIACGAGAEIVAALAERLQDFPGWRARRMGFAPSPCPTTPSLEEHFYPNARTIAAAANELVRGGKQGWIPAERADLRSIEFKGPF
jgi:pyruvate/2-oxoglutarate/acetoin dehydrogenase E1 component